MRRSILSLVLLAALLLAACGPAATTAAPTDAPPPPTDAPAPTAAPTEAPPPTEAPTEAPPPTEEPPAEPQILRLATTTSTDDSGLLDAILPAFEAQYNTTIEVIAVGTGQAIELGTNGDVDVVLVHARSREDAFVEAGDGINRLDVMYNDFIVVGPVDDPAGAQGTPLAADAFTLISAATAPFASRGDESGTNTKELAVWTAAGIEPSPDSGWYLSIGQGMGETLLFANEQGAYTLTDRATWLAQKDNLPNLAVIVGGESIDGNADPILLNPYGVIPVNPAKHPDVNFELATQFAEWITSVEAQQLIADFGVDEYGQSLFFPDSEAWKAANP
jgi:tungstate transport system substrate-binding protein